MTDKPILSRRHLLAGMAGGLTSLSLAGCDDLSGNGNVQKILRQAETLTRWAQHLAGRDVLAREYAEADISPQFKANGSTSPADPAYRAMAANGFADYRLVVAGMVERPGRFSLDQLRAMPARTQITRHDCVEGWSCIGKWTGVPLAALLHQVGVRPGARYVVLYCADQLEPGGERYYESIGLDDAFHPQTILAYAMNGRTLPIAHGAPIRLRVERQLGYKHAKYVMALGVTDDLSAVGGGKGGYWEDRGYEWYAGI